MAAVYDHAALLAAHPILEHVDTKIVKDILARSQLKTFDGGEFLTREGDKAWAYWFLLKGTVRVLYTSPQGLEVTVKMFGAPAAWAEMQVLHDYVHTEDCVAVDKATVLCLPTAAFEELLGAYPRFMKNVLLDAGARFLIAAQHERALAFLSVEQRLAHLLLSYVRLYGLPTEGGTLLRVRLSQEDLANGLGVARKSVVRAFNDWQAAGILAKRGTQYVVTDMKKLIEKAPEDLIGIDWVAGSKLGAHVARPREK